MSVLLCLAVMSTADFWKQYTIKEQQGVQELSQAEHVRRRRSERTYGESLKQRSPALRATLGEGESFGLQVRREQVARLKNEIARTGNASKLPALQAALSGLLRQEELSTKRRLKL